MSQRGDVARIRILLNDTREDKICIQSIIDKAISLSQDAATLEVANQKRPLDRLKRETKELRDLVIEFHNRLVDEVQPEVLDFLGNKPKAKPRGLPFSQQKK